MTIIEINKKLYTIPTTWNELTKGQLLAIMDTLFMQQYTGEQGCLKLLKVLAGMSWWDFFKANPEEMAEYFYLVEFLLDEKKQLTKQLIEEYDGLHGPASSFDNLKMKELAICDSYFMQWAEDRENMSLLNDFVSLLYRPGKNDYNKKINKDGDVREEFNQNVSAYNVKKKIQYWPKAVKLAIAWWYDSCRWEMVEENDEVFGGTGGEVSKYGLASVMLSVAEGGALGDFDKVGEQYVHTVMMQLNESIRRAKEIEKQTKA